MATGIPSAAADSQSQKPSATYAASKPIRVNSPINMGQPHVRINSAFISVVMMWRAADRITSLKLEATRLFKERCFKVTPAPVPVLSDDLNTIYRRLLNNVKGLTQPVLITA